MGVLNQEISLEMFRRLFRRQTQVRTSPLKTHINFVEEQHRETNWLLAIPGVVLILIGAALFGKFGVADRYASLAEAQAEQSAMQERLDQAMDYLNGSEEVTEWFEHYSWTLLSGEELNLIPRTEIADLVAMMGDGGVTVRSCSLNGTNLSVQVNAPDLQTVSRLSERVRKEDIVSACTVNTARSLSQEVTDQGVDVQMTIRIRTREELRLFQGETSETEVGSDEE